MFQENKNIFKINNFKLSLCIQTKILPIENNNNKEIINKLISNYSELKQIEDLDNTVFLKFIYFNRNKIEYILYNEDEILFIDPKKLNKNLSNFFYLTILIEDNFMVNYTFNFDTIKEIYEIYEENKKDNNTFSKSIVVSEMVKRLIDYYKETDNYNEHHDLEQFKIEKNFETKNIEEIYIDIIINLIKNNKFDDYEFTLKIFDELDLININITNLMFIKLVELLDSKNEKIINYDIKEQTDLFNTKKINFFYLLLKYIFKDSIYIYHSKFLFQTKKNIIKLIKQSYIPFKCQDKKNIEKLEYILIVITDSNYYFNLYKNKPNSNQTITQKETQDYCEDKKDNNEIIKELDITDIENFIIKILNSSSFIVRNNEKGEIFCNILNDDYNNKKINKLKQWKKIEKNEKYNILIKNFKIFLGFLSIIKEKIKKVFKLKYNLIIKLSFNLTEINNTNTLFNILCQYDFYPLNKKRIVSFQDENILVSGINGSLQGLDFLLIEINDEDYKKLLYKKDLDIYKTMKDKDDLEKKINENKNDKNNFSLYDIGNSSGVTEYEIIKFMKIMGEHKDNAEFIKDLGNGFYLSGGKNNFLFVYNKDFIKVMEIYTKICPNGVIIKYSNENNIEDLQFISYSNERINLFTLKLDKFDYLFESFNESASNIVIINSKDYIINNNHGAFLVQNLFSSSLKKSEKILEYSYKTGIKIDEKIIVFTSNVIFHNGKSILIFYDIINNEVKYQLEGYSFSISQNSLFLMENNDSKALICACKKYDYSKSFFNNGLILLILKDNQDIIDTFNMTGDFEPYCFCQIKLKNNQNDSAYDYSTHYFLVGGFDEKKRKGIIKLYKVVFEYNANDSRIEFVQDIILENNKKEGFYGFKGVVTCIIQSKDTGNFIISCSNGSVYLFSPPNINYFLFYEEQDKKDLDYDVIPFYDKKLQEEVDNYIKNKNNKYNNKEMFNSLLDIYERDISFNIDFLRD